MLTKNMYMDGLIEESEESIYSDFIQLIVKKIIGFSVIAHYFASAEKT
mgnify:FL=1